MKYAVITTGGKQYKVTEGSILEVDKLKAEPGSTYQLEKILLTVDGDSVTLGTPYLDNVAIAAKVLEQTQGKKIRVAKFKAKARYRKVQGFRAQLTKLEIGSIGTKSKKEAKKA